MERERAVLAVEKKGEWRVSRHSGIAPLLEMLEYDPAFLSGAHVVDRVVGKAAAMLMLYAGVAEAHAGLISLPAMRMFESHALPFSYDKKTEYILNRTRTDNCPMEKSCMEIEDPGEAYAVLRSKLEALKTPVPPTA